MPRDWKAIALAIHLNATTQEIEAIASVLEELDHQLNRARELLDPTLEPAINFCSTCCQWNAVSGASPTDLSHKS